MNNLMNPHKEDCPICNPRILPDIKRFELWRDYGTKVFESDNLFGVIRVYEAVKANAQGRGYNILDTESGYWLLWKD